MLCQKCHKNLASVRYAEVVDGEVTEQQLCSDCMAVYEHDATAGFELAAAAPTMRRPSAERVVRDVVRSERKCVGCGRLLNAILEEGRVGCPACYTHFAEALSVPLAERHRSLRHKGKVVQHDDTRAQLRAGLQNKRNLLRSVLRAEDYEEAARLRDEIRNLEQGLMLSESGAD